MPVDDYLAFAFAFSALFVGARLVYPLVRAFAKRVENRGQAPGISTDVTTRLERMQEAIDSVALEVERISEAQRFTTKLLSGKSGTSPARTE